MVQYLNKALDEVRAQGVKELEKQGKEAMLTLTRWCLGFEKPAEVNSEKACGFRIFRPAEVALYRSLGELPEPECTHRFC